ncbi:hypothetical protein CRD60_03825, partial [Bifidobacterium aemilianum]
MGRGVWVGGPVLVVLLVWGGGVVPDQSGRAAWLGLLHAPEPAGRCLPFCDQDPFLRRPCRPVRR